MSTKGSIMNARRPWAWPLVPLYALVSGIAQRLKARRARRLQWPVLSVGSLSAGGAGKTPVVIALIKLLQHRGWQVDVLSRGYKRFGDGIQRVELALNDRSVEGDEISEALWFGDEPVMIAQRTGADVWVGADRYQVGLAAEAAAETTDANTQRHLHLLDDGFQHVQLARQINTALVTLEDLDDALLPAGNRREPISALRKADVLVVRDNEQAQVLPRIARYQRPEAAVWIIRRRLDFDSPLSVLGAGFRPMAFCAIARPTDFAGMLLSTGCGIIETMAFPDHHRYLDGDIASILATAKRLNASGIITTEKDSVKLSPAMRDKLATIGPLLIAKLRVEFAAPDTVLRTVEERTA
ncbi:MAG: tetraacyldisaccharide 4'-kinase [Acidobacteriaceae bacterium]|nr:tetraacyldisaccharide 4'-kinase [Acidobacteriaceae bacterium]